MNHEKQEISEKINHSKINLKEVVRFERLETEKHRMLLWILLIYCVGKAV
jgi:hypothetical protein